MDILQLDDDPISYLCNPVIPPAPTSSHVYLADSEDEFSYSTKIQRLPQRIPAFDNPEEHDVYSLADLDGPGSNSCLTMIHETSDIYLDTPDCIFIDIDASTKGDEQMLSLPDEMYHG